jgi:hypothetical protein
MADSRLIKAEVNSSLRFKANLAQPSALSHYATLAKCATDFFYGRPPAFSHFCQRGYFHWVTLFASDK